MSDLPTPPSWQTCTALTLIVATTQRATLRCTDDGAHLDQELGKQPRYLHLAGTDSSAISDWEHWSKYRSWISRRSWSFSCARASSMINRASARSMSWSVSSEQKQIPCDSAASIEDALYPDSPSGPAAPRQPAHPVPRRDLVHRGRAPICCTRVGHWRQMIEASSWVGRGGRTTQP